MVIGGDWGRFSVGGRTLAAAEGLVGLCRLVGDFLLWDRVSADFLPGAEGLGELLVLVGLAACLEVLQRAHR